MQPNQRKALQELVINEINDTMKVVQEATGVNFTPNFTRVTQEDVARDSMVTIFRSQLNDLDMPGLLKGLEARFGDRVQEARIREEKPLDVAAIVFIEELVRRTWIPVNDTFEEEVKTWLVNAINAAGQEALDSLRILGSFDLTNELAIQSVKDHAAELVTKVNDTTKDLIRKAIVKGLEDKQGVYGRIGQSVRDVFDGNISIRRANTIANTEVGNAMRQANLASYKNNGIENKSWIAEPDACPLCIANEEQGVIGVDKDFVNGMTPHPNCRCDCLPELSEDWIGPLDEAWTGGESGDFVMEKQNAI